jgi:SAM-dependent methyltransferase
MSAKEVSIIWSREWQNANFEISKKKIENCLKNKESFSTYYALADLASRLNLEYDSCLDIGSGSGSYCLALKKMKVIKRGYLFDSSLSALRLAKKIFRYFGEECELILGDARAPPFKDKAFDISLTSGLLEHFKDGDQEKIICEQCRVSIDVFCQVPLDCPIYWLYQKMLAIISGGWRFGLERPFKIYQLKRLFAKCGYAIKAISYHDVLTAMFFLISSKSRCFKPVKKKRFLNKLLKHEIIIYAAINQEFNQQSSLYFPKNICLSKEHS